MPSGPYGDFLETLLNDPMVTWNQSDVIARYLEKDENRIKPNNYAMKEHDPYHLDG